MEEQVAQYAPRGSSGPLPPPVDETSLPARLRRSFFSTPLDAVLTIVIGLAAAWAFAGIVQWAIVDAVFSGADRTACLGPDGGAVGACWAFVRARLAQFVFGLYPVDERWRVVLVFVLFFALLVPLATPSAPFKRANAVLLATVFPILAFVLLTGGRVDLAPGAVAFFFVAAAAGAVFLANGSSPTAQGGVMIRAAVILLAIAAVLWVLQTLFGSSRQNLFRLQLTTLSVGAVALSVLSAALAAFSLWRDPENRGFAIRPILPVAAVIVLVYALSANFGLARVPTNLWGGLMLTFVVAVTGIAASLPLGILLALGRQSKMPAVKLLCVIFIEAWRGVPLITILFMATFMLPLFLPSGMSFNQLLRVLVGVALFASAYMAEVIRGGLQAIPRGQYEGADAMGLSYWQKMRMIVLPQALTLVIPGIVNTFIGLAKDTSLVYIVGLADLTGTVRRGFNDPTWITPSTAATGLVFAGFVYWVICFGMSRYSIFMERRLARGHKH